MGQTTIYLGDNAELIIDEPGIVSSAERALILTQAVVQEFSGTMVMSPSSRSGSLPIRIGYTVYHIYYQLRVKRIMSALTAYSEAIHHIENNPYLYDRRLASKAIAVLRECHRRELK